MFRNDAGNAPLEFVLLTEELVQAVAPWFDDANTIRYLGTRDWVYRELNLMQTASGSEFKGRRVLARYVWIAQDQNGQPCGLLDLEPYADGTAGMAFLIAPHQRGRGLGTRLLSLLETRPEVKSLHAIMGGVEPENISARRCLEKAGYTLDPAPDEEGFLRFQKRL